MSIVSACMFNLSAAGPCCPIEKYKWAHCEGLWLISPGTVECALVECYLVWVCIRFFLCLCISLCVTLHFGLLVSSGLKWTKSINTFLSKGGLVLTLRFWGGGDSWRTVHWWRSPPLQPPTPGVRDCGLGTSTPPLPLTKGNRITSGDKMLIWKIKRKPL